MLLIPPEIPNFMDTTVAAAKIRSCYIQHIISSILLARIFQPFLFTIGTQYGGVDTFLQCLSTDIRRKSERRESVWRQTTLRAAYTVSKAKETTNVVAGVIVDEIVDDIKHFAHPLHWPVITLCVQRIVKSAAEVWRFARIERELIKAFMTEVDTPDSDWPQPEFDSTTHIETNSERDAAKSGQLILCLLPHIEREPVHESFLPESNKPDNGPCIYLQGRALYSDSAAVLARQRELEVRVNTFKAPMDEMAQRITECQSVQ